MNSPVRRFVLLAFALTWGIGGIALLAGHWSPGIQFLSPSSPLYYLAGYAVSLTGIVLTVKYAGYQGLRDLGRRLLPRRAEPPWYLIVLLGYAILTVGSLQIAAMVQPDGGVLLPWPGLLAGLPVALLRDPGPLGEEFGWRGFALPRLLERYSPLSASLRLGILHTIWHLPLFFIPGMPQTQVSFPLFTVGVLAIAIFNTAAHLRSKADMLLAVLIHLLANVGGGLALQAHALNYFLAAEGLAAALLVLSGGLRSRVIKA